MKKKVAKFIATWGCTAKYSGNTKTMYIHGIGSGPCGDAVLEKFGFGLPFKIA